MALFKKKVQKLTLPSFSQKEEVFGGKYVGLQYVQSYVGFNIPFTIPISVQQVEKIIQTRKEIKAITSNLPYSKEGYIIRSSSPLEGFNKENQEFSGIYKSICVKNKTLISSAIKEIVDFNSRQHIEFLHKSYSYKSHPYIPLIIQPIIKGEFAGVVNRVESTLYITISPEFNFGITGTQGKEELKYIFFIEEKRVPMDDFSQDFLLLPLIQDINQILERESANFTIEFTSSSSKIIFLQFKKYDSQKTDFGVTNFVNFVYNKKKVCFENIRNGLLSLMYRLGYSSEEFSLYENHYFLLYHYLGFHFYEGKKFEHLRIAISTIKFPYISVRAGGKETVYPRSKELQELIYAHLNHFGIEIIFINFVPRYSYERHFFSNDLDKKIRFYHDFTEYSFDKKEEKFLLQRMSYDKYQINALTNLIIDEIPAFKILFLFFQMRWKQNFPYYKRLIGLSLKGNILAKCMKAQLKKDFLILNLLSDLPSDPLSNEIYGSYGFYNRHQGPFLLISNLKVLETLPKQSLPIAFFTNDFEPTWIPFLDRLSLIIIPRGSLGSHGVAIASEFKKNIIFDVKNFNKLQSMNKIRLDIDEKERKVYIIPA